MPLKSKQTEKPAPLPGALAFKLSDASRLSGLSEPTLRRRAKEGHLTLVKVAGRTLVQGASLRRLLGLESES